MMRSIQIAPVEERPRQDSNLIVSSWKENLVSEGYQVEDSPHFAETADALIVPYTIFNSRGDSELTDDAMYLMCCFRNAGKLVFSQVDLRKALGPNPSRFGGRYAYYEDFMRVVDDIGEVVIGQDISIITRKLGEN